MNRYGRIAERYYQEAGLPENPTYLQIRAAHEQVRKSADEMALAAELVYLPPEPGTEDREPSLDWGARKSAVALAQKPSR